jgi:nicotinate-nucleotide pyrophosphorylase (carboxylating)
MDELNRRIPSVMKLLHLALEEDIGTGDVTTDAVISSRAQGKAEIVAKAPLVLAGISLAEAVFRELDPLVTFSPLHRDGDRLTPGDAVCRISGRLRALLTGERTALNFLQRLSGIATHVRNYMTLLGDRPVRLVDTRKTIPGWRVLEKYAVRVGGAANHRMSLSDGILIKDNHIAAAGGIRAAVEAVRRSRSHLLRIEIEVTDIEEVEEALAAGADVIMLDNMSLEQIRKSAGLIKGKALIEVSGGVTRDQLTDLVDAGVDIISSGALTHSAVSVDISMSVRED